MKKRVLIVHARAGLGHISAAKALEEAFAENHPDVEVKNVDIIDFSMKIYKEIFVHGYNFLSEKVPPGWGLFYNHLKSKSAQTIADTLSKIAMDSKFLPFIKEYNPDFIIATYPLATRLISISKRQELIDIPSAMVVTDFGFHSFWVDKETNYYFAATEELKTKITHAGVGEERIVVTGIPIRKQFSKKIDAPQFLPSIGLRADIPTFLILGGQYGHTTLEKVVQGVRKNVKETQFIIISGRCEELKKNLETSFLQDIPEVKIFDFVKNIEDFMGSSSLIFTKAGGLTVSECLAIGTPMIIYKIIPGQEEGNMEYCVRMGAALKVRNVKELISRASRLLGDPKDLEKMKKACLNLGKPHAAKTIVDFIYKKIS